MCKDRWTVEMWAVKHMRPTIGRPCIAALHVLYSVIHCAKCIYLNLNLSLSIDQPHPSGDVFKSTNIISELDHRLRSELGDDLDFCRPIGPSIKTIVPTFLNLFRSNLA